MSLLKSLARSLTQQVSGRRTWTPAEVRELIDRKEFVEARRAAESLTEDLEDRQAIRCSLLGEVAFQQRDDEGARRAFDDALKLNPALTSAHYGLSLLLSESGQLEDALRHAFFASKSEPNDARYNAQVGYCQLRLGNYPLAESPLRRASLLKPDDAHTWNNLGLVLLAKGNLREARDSFRIAVRNDPQHEQARSNLEALTAELKRQFGEDFDPAVAPAAADSWFSEVTPELASVRRLEHDGELQQAIDACEALVLARDEPGFVLELSRLYGRAGDPASGVSALEAFLARHPNATEVEGALGLLLIDLQQYAQAEARLGPAVDAAPDSPRFVIGLARALMGQERFDDAAPWVARSRELSPDDITVRTMETINLAQQCRYEDALRACDDLEALGTRLAARAMAYVFTGRFDEARGVLDNALAGQPNDPLLRFHRANLLLMQHEFAQGWDDYAFRGYSNARDFRVPPFPLWRGEPLQGKRLLVLAEQGLGDQVMFASCLPDLLKEEPADVVLEAVDRIAPTLQRSFEGCRVVPSNQSARLDWLKDFPSMDYYIPLGDLPRLYRRSVESFPDHAGYLRADPARVAHWRAQLAAAGPGPYIGVSWKGGTEGTRAKLRTVEALMFLPLVRERPATWVCLQYGKVADQVAEAEAGGFSMSYWPQAISNLDEFAALVSALDLTITVCNTTVHYAGALGRPVWILAPQVPEWRYGAKGSRMPWYPSATIYRQQEAGDWPTLFESMRPILSAWRPDALTTVQDLSGSDT